LAEAEAEGDALVADAAGRVVVGAAEVARVDVAEATAEETEAITELVEAAKLELVEAEATDEVDASDLVLAAADEPVLPVWVAGALPEGEAPPPRQLESELPWMVTGAAGEIIQYQPCENE
jgi:hypothetical protein